MISERAYAAELKPVESDTNSIERGLTISLNKYWDRIGLGGILLLATILNFFGLTKEGFGNTYYAAAIRSMLENWHNFFFNAFDPGGFVTIDKPPLGFWLQAASAKLFGFSGVSLMLPQALAGVASVVLLYILVSKVFGKPAGLLAALILAITPISVVANRTNIVDGTLVLAVLLGVWALSKALESGKLRWLLLSAIFVGLGFNIKMLEAYLVLPAFGLVYLLGARVGWRKRIGQLFLTGLVLLVVSFSWVFAVDLTPASQRPWVGSTTNNSELSLAIGYNGLQRLTGNRSVGGGDTVPGSSTNDRFTTIKGLSGNSGAAGSSRSTGTGSGAANPGPGVGGGPGGGGPGGVGENGPTGALRLLDTQLGSQIGWLLPLAVIGFFVAAWQTRRRLWPLSAQQSALVLWGMWFVTMDVFFDIAGFYHTYYLTMVGPAIAALSGIGIVALWRAYRESGSRIWWLLPISLLAVAGVQVHILADYPAWSRWLDPVILGLAVLAGIALTVLRLRSKPGIGPILVALLVGVGALLAGPAVWSVQTVSAASTGITPRAGASGTGTLGGLGGFAPRGNGGSFGAPNGSFQPPNGGPPPGGNFPGTNGGGFVPPTGNGTFRPPNGAFRLGGGGLNGLGGDQVNTTLLKYLEAHQGTATYLFATRNAGTAEPYIIATGKPVMAMGGFTGSDPILTASKLATLARDGKLKYFLIDGGGFGGRGSDSSVTSWIQQHSKVITVGGTQIYEYTG